MIKAKWWTKRHKNLVIGITVGLVGAGAISFLVWRSMPAAPESRPLTETQAMMSVKFSSDAKGVMLKPVLPVTRGLVVYPESNVNPAAYAYKLSGIAQSGVLVIIAKMPLNLPPLDNRALADFAKNAPEVTDWYVAGHGEGGKKACEQAKGTQYKGLILLGSYCTTPVNDAMEVLSIKGGNDSIVTDGDSALSNYNVPSGSTDYTIDGLNHAGFGDYGTQNGDGKLDINDADARSRLTEIVSKFMGIATPAM